MERMSLAKKQQFSALARKQAPRNAVCNHVAPTSRQIAQTVPTKALLLGGLAYLWLGTACAQHLPLHPKPTSGHLEQVGCKQAGQSQTMERQLRPKQQLLGCTILRGLLDATPDDTICKHGRVLRMCRMRHVPFEHHKWHEQQRCTTCKSQRHSIHTKLPRA